MSKNYVSTVIKTAESQLGYLEKKSNKDLYDKTANAGSANYTKYAHEFDTKYVGFYNGKKNGFACSDEFVRTIVRWQSNDLVNLYNDNYGTDGEDWEEISQIKSILHNNTL